MEIPELTEKITETNQRIEKELAELRVFNTEINRLGHELSESRKRLGTAVNNALRCLTLMIANDNQIKGE
jgi:hypothetical protein